MPHDRYTGNMTTLLPGDILPSLRLPLLTGDGAAPVGPNRKRSNLLVLTHPQPCDDCGAYLAGLAAIADRLSVEKAAVMAVVGPQWRGAVSLPVPAVVDDGILRSLLSSGDEPVVAVADRFGQLFTRDDAGPWHEFPDHEQVLGTLLNIAISCPECGVPDVPCAVTLPEHGTMSGGMRIGQT
ncbi:MAG: hypothetical protein KY452_05065 [Actinobacteria bacterium]|nr:hypothetical protein [Actinomycetota bacterium]